VAAVTAPAEEEEEGTLDLPGCPQCMEARLGHFAALSAQRQLGLQQACPNEMNWLQRTPDITYRFFKSLEIRYNEVLLYLKIS